MYNKIFTKILDSSIWLEADHIRLVWITFIAVMDKDDIVNLSSIGNVAARARVTEEQAEDAIRCLESPDTKNPDQDYEGRRIERIPGVGWYVLNGEKYREIVRAEDVRAQTRERVRRLRAARQAQPDGCNADVTQCNESVTPSLSLSTNKNTTDVTNVTSVSGPADDPPPPPRKKKKTVVPDQRMKEAVGTVFEAWQKIMKHPTSRLTDERKAAIMARLQKGFTADEIILGILGCKKSPNHNGSRDGAVWDDIELICRNDTKLDQFIALANSEAQQNGTNSRHSGGGRPSSGAIIKNRPYRN